VRVLLLVVMECPALSKKERGNKKGKTGV